jgi:transposase
MRKVALDLGTKKIAYCEVFEGQVADRGTVSELESLQERLGPKAPPAVVAIEACREAWFVHAKLTSWHNDVLIVDTTRSRQLGIAQHGRKTDRIDAEVLARAVERGGIPTAHVLSPHRQALRRQLGLRRALVETRTQYVTTARGLARELGCKLPSCNPRNFTQRCRSTRLPNDVTATIDPLLAVLELIGVQLAVIDAELDRLCDAEPVIALLKTAPGVGPIVAAAFVSVIDQAGRFRNAHQLESYLGLVPNENTSGGKQRLGAITKQGNSYLRSMLVQGAWSIVRSADRDDPLRVWGEKIMQRRSKRVGVVAVARRLAGVLWAMWRDGVEYDPHHADRIKPRQHLRRGGSAEVTTR